MRPTLMLFSVQIFVLLDVLTSKNCSEYSNSSKPQTDVNINLYLSSYLTNNKMVEY